jgi:hypothetical protein
LDVLFFNIVIDFALPIIGFADDAIKFHCLA